MNARDESKICKKGFIIIRERVTKGDDGKEEFRVECKSKIHPTNWHVFKKEYRSYAEMREDMEVMITDKMSIEG